MLQPDGNNVDIWTMSLTVFTCLYAIVTGKLIMWTRWWTKVSFFFYSVMSICVYILYMWFSNYWDASHVRHTVTALHESPLFWLTLILVGGTTFVGDVGLEYARITFYKDGSDYVREFMKGKRADGWNDLPMEVKVTDDDMYKMETFMSPIKKYHRENDLKREAYLDR